VIPSSVVVLGDCGFCTCSSLEYVIFESGARVERIEAGVFQESGLKSIVIPSSVVVLGDWSFRNCRSLKSVIFESGSRLERIGESAFSCETVSVSTFGWVKKDLLASIVIPSSVLVLGDWIFFKCGSL
jgi:hypothetical protein